MNRSELELLLAEVERRKQETKYLRLFADKEKYPVHNHFFEAGAKYKQRLFQAGNRVAKTTAAMCELVMHATGIYPEDWKGKVFDKPQHWWIVGRDSDHCNEGLQPMLLGAIGEFKTPSPTAPIGSHLIPKSKIDFETLRDAQKSGVGVGSFRVKHVSGGFSTIEFKSAQSPRAAFQGTERSILIDEECPYEVYEECLLRTMTGGNIMILTFTPLSGLTKLITTYCGADFQDWTTSQEVGLGRYYVNCSWEQAPHLSQDEIQQLEAALHPHQREARRRGIPSLGSGLIYPVEESKYVVEPFAIPKHWKRVFGMDVGFNHPTAVVWLALDPESNVSYIYSEHKLAGAEPAVHAEAIKARGDWIPGVIDSASNGGNQFDGEALYDRYSQLGLNVTFPDKAVEAGLYLVWELLVNGQLKIFNTCTELIKEMRMYRKDEKGRIVKTNDDLCDALRYVVMSGREIAAVQNPERYIPRPPRKWVG